MIPQVDNHKADVNKLLHLVFPNDFVRNLILDAIYSHSQFKKHIFVLFNKEGDNNDGKSTFISYFSHYKEFVAINLENDSLPDELPEKPIFIAVKDSDQAYEVTSKFVENRKVVGVYMLSRFVPSEQVDPSKNLYDEEFLEYFEYISFRLQEDSSKS